MLSGTGCSQVNHFLEMDNETFGQFFWHLERSFKDSFHLTRLDIAIDDKNEVPYFTPEQLKRKCEKEEFIANSNSYRFVESYYSEKSTAKTVYIGTGSSNLSYRFYDKDKEISLKYNEPLDDIGSWKRTEMQLRNNKAHSFAMLFKDYPLDLGKLAFNLLGSNLRFVIPNNGESNKSRWKTCQFWERFLGAVELLKFDFKKPQSTLLETQKWLREGGVLSAVKAFSFLKENQALDELEPLELMIKRTRYSQNLCNKIVEHLNLINRQDLIPLVYKDTKNI